MKQNIVMIAKKVKECIAKGRWSFAFLLLLITMFFAVVIIFYYAKSQRDTKATYSRVIVIDAGHGGDDPGKVSTEGVLEKDINLEIALMLKQELEERGFVVVMTREADEWISTPGATNKKKSDMNNRVEIINASDADYLISIHQNSYADSSVKGAQVFYHGMSEKGRELAQNIQDEIKEAVDTDNKREIKEGNDYFILRRSICPGVIVECGFLSSPEETAKLVDETYQQKLACAIADALCETVK